MPIYEYQCCKCSHRFEVIAGASEKESRISCPRCGDSKPQRIPSSFSCGGKDMEKGPVSPCGPKPTRFT